MSYLVSRTEDLNVGHSLSDGSEEVREELEREGLLQQRLDSWSIQRGQTAD